jgi:predicted acylesterase/phospholipase RssA
MNDYFDYVAGTSNGGIIAAGIAVGMSVQEILDFYLHNGAPRCPKLTLRCRASWEASNLSLRKATADQRPKSWLAAARRFSGECRN